MLHTEYNELILCGEDGRTTRWIAAESKKLFRHELEELMIRFKEDPNMIDFNSATGTTKTSFFKEVVTVVPMLCNMLVHKGIKRVLLVGHIDIQENWILTNDLTNRINHTYNNNSEQANHNLLMQFIPIVAKKYDYDLEFVVVKPPQPRNRDYIFDLYDYYDIKTVGSNQQYQHGLGEMFYIKDDEYDNYFDSILFSNIDLKHGTTSIHINDVLDNFYTKLKNNYTFLDFKVQPLEDKQHRFVESEKESFHDAVDTSLNIRKFWMPEFLEDYDASEYFWDFFSSFTEVIRGSRIDSND